MSETEEVPLDSHTIELADTRPIMWSIPYAGFLGQIPRTAAIIMSGVAALCFSQFGSKYCLWFPFAWYLLAQFVEDNYHGLTYIQKYLETSMLFCLNRTYQGGVSATPFPADKRKFRGIV